MKVLQSLDNKGDQVTEDQVRDLDLVQDIDADNNGLESQEFLEQDSSRSLDDYGQKNDRILDAIKY